MYLYRHLIYTMWESLCIKRVVLCRYKLVSPALNYAELHQQMQQRLDLCTDAVKLLRHNSSLTSLAAAESAYADASSIADASEQQELVVSFVEAQVSAWLEVTHTQLQSVKDVPTAQHCIATVWLLPSLSITAKFH